MKEAEARAEDNRPGAVAGRLVAEVFTRLLQGDSLSYLAQNSSWTQGLGAGSDFKMADLLRVAGVATRVP